MLSSAAVHSSPAQQQQQHAAGIMHRAMPEAVGISPGSAMHGGRQPPQPERPDAPAFKEHLLPTFTCVEDAKAALDRLCQSISRPQRQPEDKAELAQLIRRPPALPTPRPAGLQPSHAHVTSPGTSTRTTAADKLLHHRINAAPATVSVPLIPTTDGSPPSPPPPSPPPPEVMEMATRELGPGPGIMYSASLGDGYRSYLHSLGDTARVRWRQQAWEQLGEAFRSGQDLPSSLLRAAEDAAAESFPATQSGVLGSPCAGQLGDWEGESGVTAADAPLLLPGPLRPTPAPSFHEYARAVRAEMEARETALTFERERVSRAGRRGAVKEIPGAQELLIRWRDSMAAYMKGDQEKVSSGGATTSASLRAVAIRFSMCSYQKLISVWAVPL